MQSQYFLLIIAWLLKIGNVLTLYECSVIVLLKPLLFVLAEPLSEFMYEYEAEIDVGFLDLFPVDYLRNLVTNTSLPLTLNNNTHITDIDMTTGKNLIFHSCQVKIKHFLKKCNYTTAPWNI